MDSEDILNKQYKIDSVRNQILRILTNPSTVTEIKNKLPKIKSFGTIAYHLKELELDHIITKEKQKKIRGQPTIYKIQTKDVLSRINQIKNEEQKVTLLFLEYIKDHPYANTLEVDEFLDGIPGYYEAYQDIPSEAVNNRLASFHYKISGKGLKFLKDHTKT